MEPNVLILVTLIFIILIGSACCSGAEAAFLAVNSMRILELAAKQKTKGSANQLLKLRKHLGRTLTVITITNNGFNIIGSLILGFYGALLINNRLGLTIFSIGFYTIVVLIGEVVPKAIGTRFSLQIAILSVPILRMLNIIMRPFLTLIEKLFPVITAENEISTDEEDIRQMAKIGSQKGLIEADEAAMISKVFQLNDLKAKDLMIPRVSAPSINGCETLENISQLIVVGEKSSSIKFNTPALFYKNTSYFEADFTNLNLYNHHILLKGKNNKLTQLISDKLEAKKHQTKLEIDLNKVEYNFNKYKSHLSKEVKILAMIKAAGYGAGIVEMGKKLQNCQVDFLGVAYVDEGVELRRNGIEAPILVMNVGENNLFLKKIKK